MKNKFYLCLLALAVGASACNKDEAAKLKPDALTISNNIKSKLVLSTSYRYIDLDTLQRAPGQTDYTYYCLWDNAPIYVESPSYQTSGAFYTGAPLYAQSIHSGPMQGGTNYSVAPTVYYADQYGVSGFTFALVYPTICGGGQDLAKLSNDIATYEAAMGSIAANGAIPQLMDYVGSDYGSSGCPQVTDRLKLIRSTTSNTGYAVATSDYPTTNPSTIVTKINYGQLNNSGKSYELTGLNNLITGVYNIYSNWYGPATGTITDTGINYHLVGSFVNENGVTIPFDFTKEEN